VLEVKEVLQSANLRQPYAVAEVRIDEAALCSARLPMLA
jgi:hypothetical protein